MFIATLIALGIVALTRSVGKEVYHMPTLPQDAAAWLGWVWPVPITDGRIPSISQEFKPWDGKDRNLTTSTHNHLGVDVMFRKRAGDPPGRVKHDASPNYIAPAGTLVLASYPGKVWNAGVGDYGHFVELDHGNVPGLGGLTTFYQHLANFTRPWKKGDLVRGGEVLGLMGFAPKRDSEQLRHLHFELRVPRAGVPQQAWPVNPAPYMRFWRKVQAEQAVV